MCVLALIARAITALETGSTLGPDVNWKTAWTQLGTRKEKPRALLRRDGVYQERAG